MRSPTRRRRLERLFLAGAAALSAAWGAGRALGDGRLWTGLLFYIPTPVVAVVAASAGALLLRRRRLGLGIASLLAAVLFCVYGATTEIRWSRPAILPGDAMPDDEAYTLVHWNVFRNYTPWSRKIERLRRTGADIFVLNELPREVTRGNWALRLGPGMDYAFGDLMTVACRGTVTESRLDLSPGLIVLRTTCRMTADGRDLRIFAVDMAADVTMARDPVLARLVAMIEEHRPDLVVGDFNAPRRSRRLQALPAGYVHAYDAAGAGWPYTWPMPVPVLAIDQCILGPDLRPIHHRYVGTLSSDHRLQVLRFARADSRAASP